MRLPSVAPLAALLAAGLIFMSGCGSSDNNGTSNVTEAEITSSMSTFTSTLHATQQSDLTGIVDVPAIDRIFGGSFGKTVLPVISPPFEPHDMARRLMAMQRSRADKPGAIAAALPTGSYRVVSADSAVRYSDVPFNGLFIILPSVHNAVAGDSDSVRVSNVTYLPPGQDNLRTFTLDAYVKHPTAPATDHHVAHITFVANYNLLKVPTDVTLHVTLTQILDLGVGLTANLTTDTYGLTFAFTNHLLGDATLDLALSVTGTGNPLNNTFVPTSSTFVGGHSTNGVSWKTTMNLSNIYFALDSKSGKDSATVTGNIQKNNVVVANLSGTLKRPVAPDTCAPVVVTIVSNGHQTNLCNLGLPFLDFSTAKATRRFVATYFPPERR